jgi:pimeloyl-ACP methyl ester carboxylesterase/organic hydroperoxide reductase OsmC/OhrA
MPDTSSSAGSGADQPADESIVAAEHWVQHDGIRLYLWEKCQGAAAGRPVVVLAHGSSTPGRETFDLRVPGKPSYSLMDFLAREGFDVFAADVRGFGRSTRPEAPVTTAQAADDLDAVVDYVRDLRGAARVSLLAWSWGTQYAGMFIAAHPDMVARYVSYAQMHADSADIARRRARLDTYRRSLYVDTPEPYWKARFHSGTPAGANDPEVINAYAVAAARVQPATPTGPQLDLLTLLPMVRPEAIAVPTLMIHGEYDDVADRAGLMPFFERLPNPDKKYVVVPDAGHMMHLQKGHAAFQQQVVGFLRGKSGDNVDLARLNDNRSREVIMSEYTATIRWQRGEQVFTDNRYSRTHRWRFDGGAEIPGSAAPSVVPPPRSDPAAVDPEEAFVASLSSCHMLWFLTLAAKQGFRVDSYEDQAGGVLAKDASGRMAMTRVTLRPQVRFSGDKLPSAADIDALHHEAHEKCFIANSVKTEVRIEPVGVT